MLFGRGVLCFLLWGKRVRGPTEVSGAGRLRCPVLTLRFQQNYGLLAHLDMLTAGPRFAATRLR
ncbi:MAG: hypothetical protein ACUVTZ_04795 [Armatimonadota bacterium]